MTQVIDQAEWRKHGLILLPCVIGVMLVAVPGCALGLMLAPLQREFGWSRAQISACVLFPAVAAVLVAPFVGRAVDRLGPRLIAIVGVPLFCLALAQLAATSGAIWSWWLHYALVGLATILVFPTVWTAAIRSRFDRNRGLAFAVALSGTGKDHHEADHLRR